MKLHLPDIIRHLRDEPLGIIFMEGEAFIVTPKERGRNLITASLQADMHKAEKYIFDSGNDSDPETTSAVRETAIAMLEFKIFHLPAPVIWIEDPFYSEVDKAGTHRRYYLCREEPNGIRIAMLQNIDPVVVQHLPAEARKRMPRYTMTGNPCFIDFEVPDDKFSCLGAQGATAEMAKLAAETVYAFKKFIVTLAAQQTVKERVEPTRVRGAAAGPRREYAHTIVRVPTYIPEPSGDTGATQGPGRRRMGLVSGYVWGKNTRPLDEQRWIAPFWRGNAALGLAPPRVRVVGARSKG
jgi:hypothetical protein